MRFFETRYKAEKDRRKGEEVVVKCSGGFLVMTYDEYRVWKLQK